MQLWRGEVGMVRRCVEHDIPECSRCRLVERVLRLERAQIELAHKKMREVEAHDPNDWMST
jgi:hypothetical protein